MSTRATATTVDRPERRRARPAVRRSALATLTVSALGVVFGDIGTSPLYALQSVYSLDGGAVRPTPAGVYGVVSLVFWAITAIVSVKTSCSSCAPTTTATAASSRVRIRQGHRTDRELLVRGFEHLGPESRYRRFLASTHALDDRTLRYMTELDHDDHEAMIALDVRGQEGLGDAFYVRDGRRPDTAEVAVTVSTNGEDGGSACCCSR